MELYTKPKPLPAISACAAYSAIPSSLVSRALGGGGVRGGGVHLISLGGPMCRGRLPAYICHIFCEACNLKRLDPLGDGGPPLLGLLRGVPRGGLGWATRSRAHSVRVRNCCRRKVAADTGRSHPVLVLSLWVVVGVGGDASSLDEVPVETGVELSTYIGGSGALHVFWGVAAAHLHIWSSIWITLSRSIFIITAMTV